MRGHTLAVGSSDTFPVGCGMVPLCLHTMLLGRLACIDYPLQWVVKLQATSTGEQLPLFKQLGSRMIKSMAKNPGTV